MTDKRSCFVIAPIGEKGSEIRARSDKVLKHVICPVTTVLGYSTTRADQIAEPGLITSHIIQHVTDDDLVIADLTGQNPNVFYELAIRHMLRKPLVQLIAKSERIPFDVAGMRTIELDIGDLDNVEEAKDELSRQIAAVSQNPSSLHTPISFAFDLNSLRQSDDAEERSLAGLATAISDLRSGLANIERRIRDPEELLPPAYLSFLLRAGKETQSHLLPTLTALDRIEGTLEDVRLGLDPAKQAQLREAMDVLAFVQKRIAREASS